MRVAVTAGALAMILWCALAQQSPSVTAQTPEETGTPAATATPAIELRRPEELIVHGGGLRWSDQSRGEEGYRVTVTLGEVGTRIFELPSNSTSFDFPQDFRPVCGGDPPRGTVRVEIVAFAGAETSEAATGGIGVDCPPLPLPQAKPALPATGAGSSSPVPTAPLAFGVLLILTGGGAVAIGWRNRGP